MKLKGKQKILWDEVDRVLWEEWDPIGVHNLEATRDEYRSYVPSIFKLLMGNESAKIIAYRLNEHARASMGLQPNPEHNLIIAQRLISLKEQINEQRPTTPY